MSKQIRIRAGLNIGAIAAEDDAQFLADCFIRPQHFDVLLDTNRSESILLGRTGSGKSASLIRLQETEDRCRVIEPEALALSYLANSTILKNLIELGVDLTLFFKLLWRHIFVVEALGMYFDMSKESGFAKFKAWLFDMMGTPNRKAAAEYLDEWAGKFWLETETRIKEITTKLETDIKAKMGAELYAQVEGSFQRAISEEVKAEIISHAQHVVHEVQMQKLVAVTDLIATLFNDAGKSYYILIDKLDENWIDDKLKYRLIRAMVETVKNLRKVPNFKIVIAMRVDLLEEIYRATRDSGFQSEKYEGLNVDVKWEAQALHELVDKRMAAVFKRNYTKENVRFYDVFPSMIESKPTMDYMVTRTLKRPRDIISFINIALAEAAGSPDISVAQVKLAEVKYSTKRLDALTDEWLVQHPYLEQVLKLLRNKASRFSTNSLTDEDMSSLAAKLIDNEQWKNFPLPQVANEYLNGSSSSFDNLRKECIKLLYKVGVVGVKPTPQEKTLWSTDDAPILEDHRLDARPVMYVHPMIWKGLGVFKPKGVEG